MEPRDFADLVDMLQGWIEAHIDTLNIWSGDHMAHAVMPASSRGQTNEKS